jgi:hypothetical protein
MIFRCVPSAAVGRHGALKAPPRPVARLTEAHQAARARSSALSCLSLPQVPSARPNSLSTQELGREGRQSTRWTASRGDPSWANRGVLAPEARSASAGERRACFHSSALLLSGAPRRGTQQMCALPARVRSPGTLLSLRAQPRPVARPMEAHQAACSSRRTLSRPARPPRLGLDLAHLVEAERGRRTLQGSPGGRCRGAAGIRRGPEVRVVRVSGLPRRVFQCLSWSVCVTR